MKVQKAHVLHKQIRQRCGPIADMDFCVMSHASARGWSIRAKLGLVSLRRVIITEKVKLLLTLYRPLPPPFFT